jgi:putative transposon-encoded protein
MKRIPLTTTSEITIRDIVGFYVRTVTPFGTSAKVDCPKEHLGKKVYLVVVNE